MDSFVTKPVCVFVTPRKEWKAFCLLIKLISIWHVNTDDKEDEKKNFDEWFDAFLCESIRQFWKCLICC